MALSEHIQDVHEGTFESSVLLRSHELPVVVDFWAPWCGPCQVLGPMLERFAIEGGGAFLLAKVNVDENPNLAIRYGVQGIPAVKAFQNGEIASEFVGAQPERMVRRFLEELVPSEAQLAVQDARSLLSTRHWVDAEEAFRAVLEEDETNADAALGLVQSLLMLGQGVEAKKILTEFPAGNAWVNAERLGPLAQLLSEYETEDPAEDLEPLEASLHQVARLIQLDNLPAAMDGLLDILREDKTYRKGLPKDALLGLFTLLGDEDPLTRRYRDELASILF